MKNKISTKQKMVIIFFLYIMYNTSRRAITDNAMNIKAILHAESLHKGKFYTGLLEKVAA